MGVNVLTGDLTFRSLKPCNLKTCSKRYVQKFQFSVLRVLLKIIKNVMTVVCTGSFCFSDLKADFENTYDLDESIFVGLKGEACDGRIF